MCKGCIAARHDDNDTTADSGLRIAYVRVVSNSTCQISLTHAAGDDVNSCPTSDHSRCTYPPKNFKKFVR